MSDLISRQVLKDSIKSHNDVTFESSIEDMILQVVDDQPTAYDVEAVVRELEEKIKHHWERANYCHDNELYIAESEHIGKCEAFRETIEIVRGGRNDCNI